MHQNILNYNLNKLKNYEVLHIEAIFKVYKVFVNDEI